MTRADIQTDAVDPSLPNEGIAISRVVATHHAAILTPDALRFVAGLARRFRDTRDELLKLRSIRQREIDAGRFPYFLDQTRSIRDGDWFAEPAVDEFVDRRGESTQPADGALASGANVYVADLEDSISPTWLNCIDAQRGLRSFVATMARRRTIGRGASAPAALMVRPRGWHLDERHVRVDGEPVPASLFDFGLFIFHNARALCEGGTKPWVSLPKIEGHLEARLWNDVFEYAQGELGMARGTVRAAVLIETVLAAYEMDEILYELREHAAALESDRTDLVFNFMKRFRNHAELVLPDFPTAAVDWQFIDWFEDRLVQTGRRRGVPVTTPVDTRSPVEGLSAGIVPWPRGGGGTARGAVPAGQRVFGTADASQTFDANDGYDESAPVSVRFDCVRKAAETPARLWLRAPGGRYTERGLHANIVAGISYLASWLRGDGNPATGNHRANTATAEVARAHVWQWIRHNARLDDGTEVSRAMAQKAIDEELVSMAQGFGGSEFRDGLFDTAATLFAEMVLSEEFAEFIPLVASDYLD